MALEAAVREFWLRDYLRDVGELNARLANPGSQNAGLERVPPSVLTGDPFALKRGQCIFLIGKNPSFPGRPGDVEQAREEHAKRDFERYRARRAEFFADRDPSDQYNWRHFSRLGNLLRTHFREVTGESAREAFRRSVAVFDVLPWWSANTNQIDPRSLGSDVEPLRVWRTILLQFIVRLEPQLILVHGSGFRDHVSALLDVPLTRFGFISTDGYGGVAYAGVTRTEVPVLVHAQVTAKNGPGTSTRYGAMLSEWRRQRS